MVEPNDVRCAYHKKWYFCSINFIMHQSNIQVQISLDEQKIPQQIEWSASDSSAEEAQAARAMMLTFWDPSDKTALRIDLWTKEMMVDEMADFFYQNIMGMGDTYMRATQDKELSDEFKKFAKTFLTKFKESQLKQNNTK
ncbi:MAG: gliding motility protein GldC [Bacteroidota bacterium]